MLTKGVKWAGIKNTEGGEKDISAGLDLTNESEAFEHTFKTMSGPLQLLQVWEYSRMAIGRSLKPSRYSNQNIQFPLMVTSWNRLEVLNHLAKLRHVHKQLNNLMFDGLEW